MEPFTWYTCMSRCGGALYRYTPGTPEQVWWSSLPGTPEHAGVVEPFTPEQVLGVVESFTW